jgi:hypothetical protein
MDKVTMGLYADFFGLPLSNAVHSTTISYSFTYRLGTTALGSIATKII